MSTYFERLLKILLLAILSSVVLLWGAESRQQNDGDELRQVSEIRQRPTSHVPIESVRVGARVVTHDRASSRSETQVNPSTWKKYTLNATAMWEDGTVDIHSIETLQPPEWATTARAKVGSLVPIPFDLREMGVMDELKAKVLAIDDCPPIEDGPGRVVLSTISHLNNRCRLLAVQSANGVKEEIQTTDLHPFWSVTRRSWVKASELSIGEEVQGLHGRLSFITSSEPMLGTYKVYNLTVEGEHVYRVGAQEILVHNNCQRDPAVTGNPGLNPSTDPGGLPGQSPPSPAVKGSPYAPEEVNKRQSDRRRVLGLPADPDIPLPDRGPGGNPGGHSASPGTPHETGERNVNSNEEHSRVPKGPRGPRRS